VIPDAIRDLLEQRARFHDWLEKLDDLGGKYRPDVADRVREDYRSRLRSVEKELHGHRSELEGSLEEHRGRLEDLSRRHEDHAARLEEAELRFQVGEFEQAEWDERRAEADRALAEIGGELEKERAAVGELEGVLAEVAGDGERAASKQVEPGAWTGPAPAAARVESSPEVAEETAEEPEPAIAEGEPVEIEAVEAAALELGTESAEIAEEVEEAGEEAIEEAEEAVEETPAAGAEEDFLDELEFLESLSLDDPESFDAVSRMLEEEGGEADGDESDRGGAG
jgi:hypothetical protein